VFSFDMPNIFLQVDRKLKLYWNRRYEKSYCKKGLWLFRSLL